MYGELGVLFAAAYVAARRVMMYLGFIAVAFGVLFGTHAVLQAVFTIPDCTDFRTSIARQLCEQAHRNTTAE